MNLVPNVPAKVFSGSAVAVGYLLIENLTANEQNALGNWLMLAAQVLCTNAFYQQVQQERNQNNSATNYQNRENSFSSANTNNYAQDSDAEIEMLKKFVSALQKEIQDLESKI